MGSRPSSVRNPSRDPGANKTEGDEGPGRVEREAGGLPDRNHVWLALESKREKKKIGNVLTTLSNTPRCV